MLPIDWSRILGHSSSLLAGEPAAWEGEYVNLFRSVLEQEFRRRLQAQAGIEGGACLLAPFAFEWALIRVGILGGAAAAASTPTTADTLADLQSRLANEQANFDFWQRQQRALSPSAPLYQGIGQMLMGIQARIEGLQAAIENLRQENP